MKWTLISLAALALGMTVLALVALGASEPEPPMTREARLAEQLHSERRHHARERQRLTRKVRAARADLGELARGLGRAPRLSWGRYPATWPREARLARQLRRERSRHRDLRFWLASNLSANSHLLALVRNPTPAGNRELAAQYFGWEYPCAAEIIAGESGWDHLVWNRQGSGAYGLGQARPRSKMLAYGADAYTNPLTQLRWFRGYAEGRYGSVCGAAAHWNAVVSW